MRDKNKMSRDMEKESIITLMVDIMMVNGEIIRCMAQELFISQMDKQRMMVNGNLISTYIFY